MKKFLFVLIPFITMAALPIQTNQYDYIPMESFRVMCPYEFDLQGVSTTIPFYTTVGLPVVWGNVSPNVILIIKRIFVIYTEATSATDSVLIRVGVPSNLGLYHDFYSARSKSQWDVDTINQVDFTGDQRAFNDGNHKVMLVRCSGGKTGTGKIMLMFELSRNLEDYTP